MESDWKAAMMHAAQSRSHAYDDMHTRFAKQNERWEAIRKLHATLKSRPLGERRVHDYGADVPPEIRFLTY